MFVHSSDVNERLEHEVDNSHSVRKVTKVWSIMLHSCMFSQAITNLESAALSSKFMHVLSQTLG